MSLTYPFSAIVGQDEMKLALQIGACDPSIGGVLVFGDRGTGKSTAVRALASLLPKISSVQGCAYNCDPQKIDPNCPSCSDLDEEHLSSGDIVVPVVDLPLGATEDRVVGALDIERALADGEKVFEPGLLARANRGFLYIDEVNLLEDHLVDLLLDVAASGENIVEREGLSIRHAARFVLVGSGNPEEGELRPQLLDRFGLSVEVRTPNNVGDRIEIMRRRDQYERDAEAFVHAWKRKNAALRSKISRAKDRLLGVELSDEMLEKISALCVALGTDGLRGELTMIRASRSIAALRQADVVALKDVRAAALIALPHRMRRDPLDDAGSKVRVEVAAREILV
tara:strand:- start:148 stop:1167 length:1020 start_codon:yes stop_codon:yes gene_type:complete